MVFACKKIGTGQKIGYFEGVKVRHKTRHSLSTNGQYIEPTGPLRYLNHSCSPNARFQERWVVTLKDIPKGEEVTVDYVKTEKGVSNHFVCKCGSKKCSGKL